MANCHDSANKAPKRGFLLDPSSGEIIGPDDIPGIMRGGSLVALDCSWKKLEPSFDSIRRSSPNLSPRTLPLVLAANEVSWGKPGRLSTVEAFAVCLCLVDRWEQAERVLSPFRFGEEFLRLNYEPLTAYSKANSNAELVELQWEFFDRPE